MREWEGREQGVEEREGRERGGEEHVVFPELLVVGPFVGTPSTT